MRSATIAEPLILLVIIQFLCHLSFSHKIQIFPVGLQVGCKFLRQLSRVAPDFLRRKQAADDWLRRVVPPLWDGDETAQPTHTIRPSLDAILLVKQLRFSAHPERAHTRGRSTD